MLECIFVIENAKLYKRLFKKETIPSHDTFRRILALVRHGLLNGLLAEVLLSSNRAIRKTLKLPTPEKKIVSVDGKQLRGTGRKADTPEGIKDLQVFNVYSQDSNTYLCSEAIESKTNEIPPAQQIITEAKGEYLGGLKGNQEKVSEFARELFVEKLKRIEGCYCTTSETSHNQLEQRTYYLYPLYPQSEEGTVLQVEEGPCPGVHRQADDPQRHRKAVSGDALVPYQSQGCP